MFNIRKFGANISRLRKSADMTQSELADRLNVTRQAVSRYELGDSFPDVSILVLISDVFGVSLADLINAGEPTRSESLILGSVANGNTDVIPESVTDIVSLAPYLKPSVLEKLSAGLKNKGIDISSVVELAEYLSDESVVDLLENAVFDDVEPELLEKLMPILDNVSKISIFRRIIDGEIDWRMIKPLISHTHGMEQLVEAAIVEGALPWEALKALREGTEEYMRKWRASPI